MKNIIFFLLVVFAVSVVGCKQDAPAPEQQAAPAVEEPAAPAESAPEAK